MVLKGFAERVKRFVILRPVGLFQGFATVSVGFGEAGGERGDIGALDLQGVDGVFRVMQPADRGVYVLGRLGVRKAVDRACAQLTQRRGECGLVVWCFSIGCQMRQRFGHDLAVTIMGE